MAKAPRPSAQRDTINWDHPNALETDLMTAHVRALKAGQTMARTLQMVRGELELAVLSFRELAGEYNLQALGTVGLNEITHRRPASGVPITPMASAS